VERFNDEFLTHTQDTVIPIPPHPTDDEQLLRDVTKAVMEIVFKGDDMGGKERSDFIISNLKKIKEHSQFKIHA